MSDLASGMKTAVEAAVTDHPRAPAAAEQPDMFAGTRPALTPAQSAVSRGAGRPVGAMNKRTEWWANHILSNYPSPLVFLAETYSRPVGELAETLECDKLEALKVQQAAAVNLAPYVHQKMPTAVQVDAKTAGMLIIGRLDPGSPAAAAVQAMGLTLTPVGAVEQPKVEQDQGDGASAADSGAAVSYGETSYEGRKP